MISDSVFSIGSTHTVCQDYALHGHSPDNKIHYAIISDGCSSSIHSEIGAQILCHTAKYFLNLYYDAGIIGTMNGKDLKNLLTKSIYTKAKEMVGLYNIHKSALDATLMISIMLDNDSQHAYIFGWGDGVIVIRYNDKVEVFKYEYQSGAPFYLSYHSENESKRYHDQFGNYELINEFYRLKEDSSLWYSDTISYSYTVSPCIEFSDEITKTIKSILVCSDGLTTFKDVDKNDIPLIQVVPDFLGYKRDGREFMKSNIIFMKKRHLKEGITHFDDISVGIVLREK